jgi:predicted tellurium resistance membrane protein TerC
MKHKAFLIDCAIAMTFNLAFLAVLSWLVIMHDWSGYSFLWMAVIHWKPSKELLEK